MTIKRTQTFYQRDFLLQLSAVKQIDRILLLAATVYLPETRFDEARQRAKNIYSACVYLSALVYPYTFVSLDEVEKIRESLANRPIKNYADLEKFLADCYLYLREILALLGHISILPSVSTPLSTLGEEKLDIAEKDIEKSLELLQESTGMETEDFVLPTISAELPETEENKND